jgi:two-component system response regulator AtoC
VLQDAEFTKLGSNKSITVDVRVVTATNRDLESMMLRGQFREDLYYRLKVIEATVPPLRERQDEILPLTDFFITKYSQRYNRPVRTLTTELRERFLQYEWPGNVRELENMIKRFVILQDEALVVRELSKPRPHAQTQQASTNEYPPPYQSPSSRPPAAQELEGDDDELDAVEDVPLAVAPPAVAAGQHDGRRLADVAREAAMTAERVIISETLRQVHWNRRKAAQILGVSYKTLLNKIKETGIERP